MLFMFFSLFCSEKYLRNLLQIEVMLKVWFPQVEFQSNTPSQTSIPRLPTRWQQNQLHMPVKVSVKINLFFTDVFPRHDFIRIKTY